MAKQRSERVLKADDMRDLRDRGHLAVAEIMSIVAGTHREKNPLRQNALLKKHGKALVDLNFAMTKINRALTEMSMEETPNSSMPWTQAEDEMVVELRAKGEPIQSIARTLGRTPAACATRLSTLVGVPRSELVEQFLDGTLDEVPVRGVFVGKAKRVVD